jgi:hypothetical protein
VIARRTASPAEHYTLTIVALSIAQLTLPWVPLWAAPATATLTYLAIVTGGAWTLRWNIPAALTATTTILRILTAASIRALAWAIQAAATAALHALATAHTKTLPAT